MAATILRCGKTAQPENDETQNGERQNESRDERPRGTKERHHVRTPSLGFAPRAVPTAFDDSGMSRLLPSVDTVTTVAKVSASAPSVPSVLRVQARFFFPSMAKGAFATGAGLSTVGEPLRGITRAA
jgi:hypothetical protein